MILVDTSVWVEHFRRGRAELVALLNNDAVLTHPFVIGELACGHLRNRAETLTHLRALPQAPAAQDVEVFDLIEGRRMMGRGLGWIDAHLLASAFLASTYLWTLDTALLACTRSLGVAAEVR